MKRYMISLCVFILLLMYLIYIMTKNNLQLIMADNRPAQIIPSPVYATLPKGSVLYDRYNGKAIDMIISGSKVEIIKDRSKQWYYIKYNNKLGWVKKEALKIPSDKPTDNSSINVDEFVDYANKSLSSGTNHYVWVDIARQKVYVLKGGKGNWKTEKIMVCSTGKNISPSLRGDFKIQDRGTWFYSDRLGSGAKYWVRYNGSYLFHSVAMDKNQNIIDPTLGRKSSNGCIRMSIEDAQWFYRNIEENTSVTIN